MLLHYFVTATMTVTKP